MSQRRVHVRVMQYSGQWTEARCTSAVRDVRLPIGIIIERDDRGRPRIGVHFGPATPGPPGKITPVATVRTGDRDDTYRVTSRYEGRLFADGVPIEKRVLVWTGHVLRVGHDATFELGWLPLPNGDEEGVWLASIDAAPDDPDLRSVYADWLEVAGRNACALLLRRSPDDDAARELAVAWRDAPFEWRRRLASSLVEQCPGERGCPARWHRLRRTDEPGVRLCSACVQPVRYSADGTPPPHGPFVIDPAIFPR